VISHWTEQIDRWHYKIGDNEAQAKLTNDEMHAYTIFNGKHNNWWFKRLEDLQNSKFPFEDLKLTIIKKWGTRINKDRDLT